jgi:predicted PurR-regulated permease PerM
MMISMMRNRFLAVLVTFYMVLFMTSPSFAALIPSMGSPHQVTTESLQKDVNTIQQALESKIVQEKLKAYGLTSDEVASKLSAMTPNQIHMLATASNDLLAGGDAATLVYIVVAVIVILAVYSLVGLLTEGS